MIKTIVYMAGEKTFKFQASFCDALEMCARFQEHALENGVDIEEITNITLEN